MRASGSAAVVVYAMALSVLTGCAGGTSSTSAGGTSSTSAGERKAGSAEVAIPLGAARPDRAVRGLTVLVVGDSWARNLGVGMADVAKAQANTIVNAGLGGCGIMLPVQQMLGGNLMPTPKECTTWPRLWPRLVEQYRPQAVLLSSAYWDQQQQVIDGTGAVHDIGDQVFRQHYEANMTRAIGLLSASGATVFVANTVFGRPGRPPGTAQAINRAVQEVVQRNAGHRVRLLDVRGQLCDPNACPPVIGGIGVYDETGHPTGKAHDRLGNWILNTVWTGLGHTTA